jgi:hypothetical protein
MNDDHPILFFIAAVLVVAAGIALFFLVLGDSGYSFGVVGPD